MIVQQLVTQVDGHTDLHVFALKSGWIVGHAKVQDPWHQPVLLDLFVGETHRRSGVATAIVRTAVSETAGSEHPIAVYYLPDSPARGLLERAGFVDTGHRGVERLSPDYIWARFDRATRVPS